MKLTTIKIMKRKNLGNYEHEEITLEAVIAEHEDAAGAIIGLRDLVHITLNGDDVQLGKMASEVLDKTVAADPARAVIVKDQVSGTEAEIRFGGAKSATGQDIPEVIKEKKAPRTSKAKADAPAETPSKDAGGTSTVVGKVDTANVTHVQSEASKTEAPVKGTVLYDTTVKEHRSRFATFLTVNYPKWKDQAAKPNTPPTPEQAAYAEKVATFSKGLHGAPFEDAKGEMLPAFKAKIDSFFAFAK